MDKLEERSGSYKLNDYVTYRKNGVCQIVDITMQNFGGQGKKEYYVLKSVYDSNMKVFVPLGSELEKEMNYALTVDEIHTIIKRSKTVEDMWVDDCRERAAVFEDIINSGNKVKMIWIINAVSDYKLKAETEKRKMKANDLKYLAMAEAVVSGEFAFPLNIPKSEVIAYIKKYLNE